MLICDTEICRSDTVRVGGCICLLSLGTRMCSKGAYTLLLLSAAISPFWLNLSANVAHFLGSCAE